MGNQELAIIEWYRAMGVDMWVDETPHNRLATSSNHSEKLKSAPSEAEAKSNHVAPLTPALKASPSAPYTPPAEALHKAQSLAAKCTTIEQLRDAVLSFRDLGICRSATHPVFAQGVEHAPLMVIGEAPGAQEDRSGVPFCGPSGQLLDKMLGAIGYNRNENALITNSVYWRPPGNRTPTAEEIAICQPFVNKHIELQKPKVLFLLGGVAVRSVLGETSPLSRLRGKVQQYGTNNIPVIISYHPSYLLRQPTQKRLAWNDLLQLKALLTND